MREMAMAGVLGSALWFIGCFSVEGLDEEPPNDSSSASSSLDRETAEEDSGSGTIESSVDSGQTGTEVVTDSPDDPGFTVSGGVTRTARIEGDEGLGTLCLFLADGCPSMSNQNPMLVEGGQLALFDANMSSPSFEVPYSISLADDALAWGQGYSVVAYFHLQGGDCETQPQKGDPIVLEGMGGESCGHFTYDGADTYSDVDVNLNFNMPF